MDPYLINIVLLGQPLIVRWSSVLALAALLLAGTITACQAKQRGLEPNHVWALLLAGIAAGLVGARTWYALLNWEGEAERALAIVLAPSAGGTLNGAFVGALLAVVALARQQHLNLRVWLDLCAPALLLALALGRWGDFINQQGYGPPTSLPIGVLVSAQHRLPPFDDLVNWPLTTRFHAVFLYESLWCLFGAALLFRPPQALTRRPGTIALAALLSVALGQLAASTLRLDTIPLDRLVSLMLAATAWVGLVGAVRKPPS